MRSENIPKTNITEIIGTTISDYEIVEMTGKIPINVQIRLKLNIAGFKFQDDGKPSAIINKNPIPLGEFTTWEDLSSAKTHFKQIINNTKVG